MTIAFFKSRCLMCWKRFEVPLLSDSSHDGNLYYDKTDKSFAYFSWFNNKDIETFITEFLLLNEKLQSLNDNTKGNTARQLVGLIANGDKECILGFNRCPRCGFKWTYTTDTRTRVGHIDELNFSKFLDLDTRQKNAYLLDRIKTAYNRWFAAIAAD